MPVLALHLALLIGLGANADDDDKPLSPDQWPTTVEATVADLLQRMPPDAKEKLRVTSRSDLILYHHGLGTYIRNYYGLWRGNQKLRLSACGKPCHVDDASQVIIEAAWEKLQK
jgi:hypothetical protein